MFLGTDHERDERLVEPSDDGQFMRQSWCSLFFQLALPAAFVLAVLLIFTPLWDILTTPTGRNIPREAPDENNRVYHPYDFSMIAPRSWNARIIVWDHAKVAAPSGIAMLPGGAIPRRYSASMGVSTKDGPPSDLARYISVTFQGKPAYERIRTHPEGGFENPGRFSYDLVFERENVWYEIRYHVFSELQQLPPEIQPYLDSFRTHRRPN